MTGPCPRWPGWATSPSDICYGCSSDMRAFPRCSSCARCAWSAPASSSSGAPASAVPRRKPDSAPPCTCAAPGCVSGVDPRAMRRRTARSAELRPAAGAGLPTLGSNERHPRPRGRRTVLTTDRLECAMAAETEILIESNSRPFEGMKISWGGVFGGVLAGVGVLMLLSSLGLAIGISATDPRNPDGEALGTGAAIWTGLSLLIALFIAGWASTRLSMLWERTTAMFEGVLVWVLSLILILYLTASGIGLVASGAFNLVGTTAKAVGSSVGSSMNLDDLSSGNVDEILGRLRDPQTTTIVAAATGSSRAEASSNLQDISRRVEQARNDPARAAAEARQGLQRLTSQAKQNLANTAAEAKPAATTGAWLTFAAMVLSLLAAILGAGTGRRGVVRRAARRPLPDRSATTRVIR